MDIAKIQFKTPLWEHQKRCLNFIKDLRRAGLFPIMGAGKTKIALDWAYLWNIKENLEHIIILAPSTAASQWHYSQIPMHYSGDYSSFYFDSKKANSKKYLKAFNDFQQTQGLKFYIFAIEGVGRGETTCRYLSNIIDNTSNIMIILDEITSCKNVQSNTTKRMRVFSSKVKYFIGLSGMQITETAIDLYGIMNTISANFFSESYKAFECRYGVLIGKVNHHTGRNFYTQLSPKDSALLLWHFKKHREPNFALIGRSMVMDISDIAYLHNDFISKGRPRDWKAPKFKWLNELLDRTATRSIFVSSDELILPKELQEICYLEMPEALRKAHTSLCKTLTAQYNEHEITVQERLTLILREQQLAGGSLCDNENQIEIAENAKIEFLKNELPLLPAGDKAIVWAAFVSEIELIERELQKAGLSVASYYGKTKNRESVIESFNNGDLQILIANPELGGVGLNLQVANWNYLYSIRFSVYKYEQLKTRTVRSGQKAHTVYFKKLAYKGTVDEIIYNAMDSKMELVDYVRDYKAFQHLGES